MQACSYLRYTLSVTCGDSSPKGGSQASFSPAPAIGGSCLSPRERWQCRQALTERGCRGRCPSSPRLYYTPISFISRDVRRPSPTSVLSEGLCVGGGVLASPQADPASRLPASRGRPALYNPVPATGHSCLSLFHHILHSQLQPRRMFCYNGMYEREWTRTG